MENILIILQNFITWKSKLYSEIRGGKLMYDVPKYYKWLEEKELLQYYMDLNNIE
jgi:uncharacterized membrane protein